MGVFDFQGAHDWGDQKSSRGLGKRTNTDTNLLKFVMSAHFDNSMNIIEPILPFFDRT